MEEEAVVGSGAASASLRLSVIVAMLGSQADAAREEKRKQEWVRSFFFFFFFVAAVTDACQRQRARLVR